MKELTLIERAEEVFDRVDNFEGRDVFEELFEAYVSLLSSQNRSLDLEELLHNQRVLQDRMGWPTGRGVPGVKENFLALQVELVEVLTELPWKPWKKYSDFGNDFTAGPEFLDRNAQARKKVAMEMTDVLQFWANAALALGFTHRELTTALRVKWKENHRRVDDGEAVVSSKGLGATNDGTA